MDTSNDRRTFIVSNRLPVRVHTERGRVEVTRSSGGLASALRGATRIHEWIGWSGGPVPIATRPRVRELLKDQALVPVFLTAEEERHYYVNMCNGTLWPLLHYFPGRVEFDDRSWPAYCEVNRRFADTVLERTAPGDRVWIHDFHLFLLPQMLRLARPELEIGFFLHVPFPSSEIWRIVPQREELLRGLLGADYLSFHTADYLRHFRDSCLRVLGLDATPDSIQSEGRRVGLGVDPLGPDVATFQGVLDSDAVLGHIEQFAQRWGDRELLLSVERLDYTKGILHKLRSFARLLELEPERCQDTVMLQVLVPSREENESYRSLRREIEREVGRINGIHGSPGRMPLEFLHRSIDTGELAALYRYATACIVTPLRDGMNLVAHEFVLCQGHGAATPDAARGVLVLSEFAGAALSLTRSLPVNPWDITAVARAMSTALQMPEAERKDRMAEMYEQVLQLDSAGWATRFLRRLDRAAEHNLQNQVAPLDRTQRNVLCERWRLAKRRWLFLDYDGTLREITQRPENAAPTRTLLTLLRNLSQLPDTQVHLVSGRPRGVLSVWFGHLPIHLCAEHGFAHRAPGADWVQPIEVDLSWLPEVETILQRAVDEVPGAFLERKRCGLAWHYRLADPGYGPWRAQELRQHLDQLLIDRPAATLSGHAVLEVRAKGFDKGSYVAGVLPQIGLDDFVFCAGDDRTDVDMYRQMPEGAFVANVGGPSPDAGHVLATPTNLRELLQTLLETAPLEGAPNGSDGGE